MFFGKNHVMKEDAYEVSLSRSETILWDVEIAMISEQRTEVSILVNITILNTPEDDFSMENERSSASPIMLT